MAWEKAVVGVLARVDVQTTDTIIPVGGQSTAGTETRGINPLFGEKMWDNCATFVNGFGTVSGTWTVEVQGTVAGISALPLARQKSITATTLIAATHGLSTQPLLSLTNTSCMVRPTQVLFDNTSAGGMSATVVAIAKANRGKMPFGAIDTGRVVEGVMFSIPSISPGNYLTDAAHGLTQDLTVTLSNKNTGAPTGATTWGNLGGLDRLQMWDCANYFMDVTGASGTWNVYLVGTIPDLSGTAASPTGFSVVIAGASGIGAGTTALGVTKIAFWNVGGLGHIPPKQVVFDVTTAGASQSLSGSIVFMAKASRGQRFKN